MSIFAEQIFDGDERATCETMRLRVYKTDIGPKINQFRKIA